MSLEPVVILAETLPVGLKADFAAVLAMSLGKIMPEFLGPDTPTADGLALPGITTVALPILGAPAADLPRPFRRGREAAAAPRLYAVRLRGPELRG